ncbi:uncharacterized protein [Ptychodera flava]|uniref:uncharacterized protein n=1 Tax=Ptychodera flava TaxID=63121 RepID=UPI00396A3192
MLGTLTDEKKQDWKSYVPPLVHAYNCTKNDATGYAPYYLMFGRHPRLPIDVCMGIEPDNEEQIGHHEYAESLRKRLSYAYELASKAAEKAATSNKNRYDRKSREAILRPGDRVLVKNVRIRGKQKLANIWESQPYRVVKQCDPDLPVYVVCPENKQGRKRTLHRNLLLPCSALPWPETLQQDRELVPQKQKKAREESSLKEISVVTIVMKLQTAHQKRIMR